MSSENNLLHVDTDEMGINVRVSDDGGLDISVDSRAGWISSLEADGEKAIRIGDLFTAAVALAGDKSERHAEYARGMAELIGNFAPEGSEFSSENLRNIL